jgi:hypothetical protein
MWSFFGNGFHICERDGSDITWYLGAAKGEVDEAEVRETVSAGFCLPVFLGFFFLFCFTNVRAPLLL